MAFVVTVETEVWGDDRDPRISVSHRAEFPENHPREALLACANLLEHMTPKYRLVIERKEDQPA